MSESLVRMVSWGAMALGVWVLFPHHEFFMMLLFLMIGLEVVEVIRGK